MPAAVLATACLVVLAGSEMAWVRRLDGRLLGLAYGNGSPFDVASAVVQLADPAQAIVLIAAFGVVAAALTRPARAAAALLVLLTANAAGLLLEPLAVRRIVLQGPISFDVTASAPSNHTILVGSLAVAAALVVAPRWRAAILAAGLGATASVALALLRIAAHSPVDLLLSLLVVATATVASIRIAPWLDQRLPARVGPLPAPGPVAAAVLLGVGVLVLVLFLDRSDGQARLLLAFVAEHPPGVAGAAALCAALGWAVDRLLRGGSPPREPVSVS